MEKQDRQQVFDSMRIVYQNENEGYRDRRTSSVDINIHTRGLTDIWKENILEDLKVKKLEFTSTGDFLTELKIKEFVQEFRRIARKSRYKKQVLVKKFKREMNEVIRRKLIEVERPPRSIDQQYEYTTNLN